MSLELNVADTPIERLPPQSVDAEQAVLGAVLISADALSKIIDVLEPEHFYRKAHQVLFAAILDLFEKNEPIDIVTASQYLKDQGKLDSVGGRQYLADLALSVATTANVEYYAKVVNEKALLRNLIKAGTEIVQGAYEDTDADTAVDRAESLIFGIAQNRNMSKLVHIREIVDDSFARIEKRYEERDTLSGVPSGFYDLDTMTSGWQPSDLVIIAARPSMGKCLAYDAEIVLADGSISTIQEIYEQGSARLLTLNSDYKFGWASPSNFVDDGVKPVFRVATRLGRVIETTASHPFLTTDGWKKLAELKPGSPVAVPRHLPVFGTEPLRECEVKLLAYLLGDGCITGNTISLTVDNAEVQTDFLESATEFGAGTNLRLDFWCKQHDIWGREPEEKVIPPSVFTLPEEQLALFLNRLFASDGWTVRSSSGQPWIAYATPSERIAKQVQHLLLRFGIIAKLRRRFVRSGSERHCLWLLGIQDLRSVQTFCDHIGMVGSEESIDQILTAISAKRASSDNNVIVIEDRGKVSAVKGAPGVVSQYDSLWRNSTDSKHRFHRRASHPAQLVEFSSALRRKLLQDLSTEDIYWDEIVSIESVGEKQVYDLTIPQTHNFVANDICVHNTAFVLNLAQHAAVEHNIPVAIFSLEMSREQLVQRFLCAEAKIDANKLRTGLLQTNDWSNLALAMGRLGESPVFIDDAPVVTALDIRAKCRRLKAEYKNLGLIIIDYIQLMQGRKGGGGDNRVQEVAEISRGLKQLARELSVPVLALSQLSRAVEARQNKRPMLSDLRESGCLTGESLVFLPEEGVYKRIDSLIGEKGFKVLAIDTKTCQLERREVTKAFFSGLKQVYKLTTVLGRTIRATGNHKFVTMQGWKRLDKLESGQMIAAYDFVRAAQIQTAQAGSDTELAMVTPPVNNAALKNKRAATAAASQPPYRTDYICWDRIVSIEPDGVEPVYDLTVKGLHNFVANDIVVHNSIEQDADLVMFIYRDEYYNPESDRRGEAEIIIAKQRNGPVGTVDLLYQASITKFLNKAVGSTYPV